MLSHLRQSRRYAKRKLSKLESTPDDGQRMEVVLQDGTPLPVLITEVTETTITLDANHPLAGMDLTFDIKLVEIL